MLRFEGDFFVLNIGLFWKLLWFDDLIYLMSYVLKALSNFTHESVLKTDRPTKRFEDRPTDRQIKWVLEATCRRLKMQKAPMRTLFWLDLTNWWDMCYNLQILNQLLSKFFLNFQMLAKFPIFSQIYKSFPNFQIFSKFQSRFTNFKILSKFPIFFEISKCFSNSNFFFQNFKKFPLVICQFFNL